MQGLGIKQLACVIGPSLGGMTVLAFAAQFPNAVRNLISISAAARSTPFAIALRSLQREIIRKDGGVARRPLSSGQSCHRSTLGTQARQITIAPPNMAVRFARRAGARVPTIPLVSF